MDQTPRIAPPSPKFAALAHERLAGLATPPGALGRIGEVGAWLAAALMSRSAGRNRMVSGEST